ncbi:MAG: multicopper oxidase family protein [Rhizomicrobium sp.]
MRRLFTIGTFLAGLAAALLAPAAAQAETPIENPCAVPVSIDDYGLKEFKNPPDVESVGSVLTTTLDLRYSDPAITKIGQCGLTLRTYNGGLVGPTLRVKPGDLMKITVKNNLPVDPMCRNSDGSGDMDMSHAPEVYNVTNFHTHGLHVSPGNNPNGTHSDNIFVTICPGTSAQFEVRVPANHPPGTFWYHAHVHGSTAIQVSSTVEGAIIIKGGLDEVPQIKAAKDQIFVLQQISYDATGRIEDDQTMYENWERTGSRTLVNGQLVPLITMRPGELQRWRMIHAGVDESLFVKTSGGPLYEIATDGIALGRIDTWRSTIDLEPGYRSDVLFKAPMKTGRYYFATAKIPPSLSLQTETLRALKSGFEPGTDAKWIVAVDVKGTPNDMPLPTPAELRPLAPYKPITTSELTGREQNLTFTLDLAKCSGSGPCTPCTDESDPECTYKFMVDWYVYPNGPTRSLKLNTASKWTLDVTPKGDAHPFHVHVNHFEMVRLGPDGKDETVWKDTLMVRAGEPLKYRVIRSRYTDFAGAFVLHCHILPHEDQGMMQKVEIVP